MTTRTPDLPAKELRRLRSASDEKILAAAKELLLADRYDGVTLERVAESGHFPADRVQPLRLEGEGLPGDDPPTPVGVRRFGPTACRVRRRRER